MHTAMQSTEDSDAILGELAEQIRAGLCLPFVGAGLSCWEECRLFVTGAEQARLRATLARGRPSADQCIDAAVLAAHQARIPLADGTTPWPKALGAWKGCPPTWFLDLCMFSALSDSEAQNAMQLSFCSIAQVLYDRHPVVLAGILQKFFGTAEANRIQPNSLHEQLALLPFDQFVTTNFDTCLEIARQAIHADLCPIANDFRLRSRGIAGARLLKIHGDLSELQHSNHDGGDEARLQVDQVVLTDSQYWGFPEDCGPASLSEMENQNRRARRSALVAHVRSLMNIHRLVFLGYSLSDFNVLSILHGLDLRKGSKRCPVLITTDTRDEFLTIWRNRGFQVLRIKTSLLQFLKELFQRVYRVQFDLETTPLLSQRDKRTFIPAAILKHEASINPLFDGVLKRVVKDRFFPISCKTREEMTGGSLSPIDEECVWPSELFHDFLSQNWVTKVKGLGSNQTGDHYEFFEFHPEIRAGIIDMLGYEIRRREE